MRATFLSPLNFNYSTIDTSQINIDFTALASLFESRNASRFMEDGQYTRSSSVMKSSNLRKFFPSNSCDLSLTEQVQGLRLTQGGLS